MPYRVLVVEDEAAIRESLVIALRHLGYDVAAVRSVRDAVAQEGFDVALLDMNLPDGSGLDILTEWRRRGFDAPVIVVSADRKGETVDRAMSNLDAWEYLPKPFELPALERAVSDALYRTIIRREIEHRASAA